MATQHSKPGARLHPTKTLNPATADIQPSDETPWQHLMMIDYLMFEVIDALERERVAGEHTPLNQHWQQFFHHLRKQKPRLGVCLNNLMNNGFLAKWEGMQ